MTRRDDAIAVARARVAEERKWIDDHGGNRAAYILRYGRPGDIYCYGDGGSAIYDADLKALRNAEAALAALEGKS